MHQLASSQQAYREERRGEGRKIGGVEEKIKSFLLHFKHQKAS